MPKYTYKAQLLATGSEMEGTAEAADKFELAKNIKMEGKLLLSATELSDSPWNMDKINALLTKVDLREKILFARNMATMIQAGLPLSRALQIFVRPSSFQWYVQVRNPADSLRRSMLLADRWKRPIR